MSVSPSPDPKLGDPKLGDAVEVRLREFPISPYISLGDPVEVRLRELALAVAAEAALHGERASDLGRCREM